MIKGFSSITVHMVSSLDGYIAKEDNDISWMHTEPHYEKGHTLSQEDIDNFFDSIDCYVMGANTYLQALNLGWPYGEKPVFVLTSNALPKSRTSIQFFQGDLKLLLNERLKNFKNIWVVGGPTLIKEFIDQGLTDTIIVSILPIILGKGRPFFEDIKQEQKLNLINVLVLQDGMVELTYRIM